MCRRPGVRAEGGRRNFHKSHKSHKSHMSATEVEDRPTNVEPTETRARKERSDKGKPRGPRTRLTPGALRARADEMEKEQAARELERCARALGQARKAIERAIDHAGGQAGALRAWLEAMPSL